MRRMQLADMIVVTGVRLSHALGKPLWRGEGGMFTYRKQIWGGVSSRRGFSLDFRRFLVGRPGMSLRRSGNAPSRPKTLPRCVQDVAQTSQDACQTPQETEDVYVSRCVPRKAALDLIYARRRNLCLDLRLMVATVFRGLVPGRRGRGQPSP